MSQILEIISKDINGESSAEEKTKLKEWIAESEDNQTFYFSFLHFLKKNNEASDVDKNQIWDQVCSEIEKSEPNEKKNGNNRRLYNKVWIIKNWQSIAASVTIFFLLGISVYFFLNDQTFSLKEGPAIAENSIMVEKSIPAGKKLNFSLPDGSTIKLNGQSALRFKENFQEGNLREVYLEGEAFFNVAKNPQKPFVIHTSYSEVKVLGTSFNVNAFPENKEEKVSVSTGKVLVKKKSNEIFSDSLTLVRGEMAVLKADQKEVEKEFFNPELSSWKDGVLVFDDASFHEIVKSLERWYGVEFIIHKEVGEKGGYNARFENQNLLNVLESIKYSLKFEYEIKENKVMVN
ncbi:FecR family protein [Flexithrix dorotheae]|uniref:FecR family protein n=1 Tax=Flexithrix dorotheae TaxID=70993 RepID=UPI00039BD37C|nr:FecR family protein [Flexithrix dorotheae]